MTLDIAVVILYAAAMLALGGWSMRRARSREDYLVAGRRLGPLLYFGTLSATVLGGAATIGTVRLGYQFGISGFWLCAALGLGIVGLSLLLAKPLLELRIYTVTQVLEQRYNPAARRASALIMLVYALMIGSTSTIAIGTTLHVLFGIPAWAAVLLGGGTVVIYATIGGMWSLTLTDIVQFVIMTVGFAGILLPLALADVGGWSELVARMPEQHLSFSGIGGDTILTYFLIYFLGIFIGQDIWQRVFTARTGGIARVAGTAAGLYCIAWGLVGAVIGMCALVLLPPQGTPADGAFAAIVQHSLPPGLRGLVTAAALAALMSTSSAGLLAASTTAAQDLWPWLRGKGNDNGADAHANRIATLAMGVVVLAIALVVHDVVGALTLAYNLLVGGMLVPLIGAVYWRRASTTGAIGSMVLGSLTAAVVMATDGLLANTPIYYSLVVGTVSFVLLSMMRPDQGMRN